MEAEGGKVYLDRGGGELSLSLSLSLSVEGENLCNLFEGDIYKYKWLYHEGREILRSTEIPFQFD